MIYYLFNPITQSSGNGNNIVPASGGLSNITSASGGLKYIKGIRDPYWYKYLDIYDTCRDYLWSYRPECYFQSRLFTVYICKRHESYEEVTYNICKLDLEGNILLYYNDDVVFIETDKRRDNQVLKILNKHCSPLRRID